MRDPEAVAPMAAPGWLVSAGLLTVDGELAPRAWALVAVLALLVGIPSLGNGFAYDDVYVIVKDARVHDVGQWRSWWTLPYWIEPADGKYRPLTTTLFAIQWAVADGAPWVFHAVSVLLHAGVSIGVLWLSAMLLPPVGAVAAGAYFAVHPVHVEAYANVVGQAELLAGGSLVVGTALYLRARRHGAIGGRTSLLLAAVYLLGILAKEHAIVLPAIWTAAELTVLRSPGRWVEVGRRTWMVYLAAVLVAGGALWVRWQVLGGLDSGGVYASLQGLGLWGRGLVMLSIVPEVVRLMVWPLRLHADYSPLHVVVSGEPSLFQLPGAVTVAVLVAVMGWALLRRPVVAFAGALFVLPWLPTANLLFPSGVLLAERALYTPSVGVVLVVGAGVAWWSQQARGHHRMPWLMPVALTLLVALGGLRAATRAPVWESSERLFAALVAEQPLSAKAHLAYGVVLSERGDLEAALREWRMAARIAPDAAEIHDLVGRLLAHGGRCDVAEPALQRAIALGGAMPSTREALVRCLIQRGDRVAAREALALARTQGLEEASADSLERALADLSAAAIGDSIRSDVTNKAVRSSGREGR